jgi:hypothetical protein
MLLWTAARILVKNPETGRNAAFQAGSSCKTSKETLVLDFCSLFYGTPQEREYYVG